MKTIDCPSKSEWNELRKRPSSSGADLTSQVSSILQRVSQDKDAALRELRQEFDGLASSTTIQVSEQELESAETLVSSELREAMQHAYRNITRFHEAQQRDVLSVETAPGVRCWRKSNPIERVGLYIPGGTAPLCSTVLMLGIPAQIAGCSEVVLCTPPRKDGSVHPAILYAASLCGIRKVNRVGGAQAIAAMAYGTESISRVDKIFGPGNQYVTLAKQLVSAEGVAIDMPAGPTELLVIADESVPASFVASDLLAQAEHGVDSQVVLLTNSEAYRTQVFKEVETQLESLPRRDIAEAALENSLGIIFDDLDIAMEFSNEYAPEHLILACSDAELLANEVRNAGSVFVGPYSPESAGDYASGTNHTLPTAGSARAWSGVSLDSFQKQVTFQAITEGGLQELGPSIETLARAEELEAHARAVGIRLAAIGSEK